jgi:hypothetical protein
MVHLVQAARASGVSVNDFVLPQADGSHILASAPQGVGDGIPVQRENPDDRHPLFVGEQRRPPLHQPRIELRPRLKLRCKSSGYGRCLNARSFLIDDAIEIARED